MKEETFQKTGGLTYGHNDFIYAKSNRFSSKVFSAKPKFETWECSLCYRPILDNLSQRGMKRTKCDGCIKETNRLQDMIKYWSKKVGVEIEVS